MTKKLLSGDVADAFELSLTAIDEHHYTIERLTKNLRHFEGELDRQLEGNSKIVDSHVRQLISDAKEFLKLCQANGKAPHVRYCLAAVDYLTNTDDAIPDFADYDGFEDDRQVFDAVIKEHSLKVKNRKKVA